jgi:hypothetical protein
MEDVGREMLAKGVKGIDSRELDSVRRKLIAVASQLRYQFFR